ncbi:TIGR03862 family flavoprotein [Salipiger sp. PrR002]|uniref:TIGR03862 family flavoprotein n=1 Tax=Salipiger sp. PrR002 TaxID=2706489 RepID=UPI0013BD3B4F|nr:TIGR03862 family flavoprotein [Salipiger sp. PrR002]NDW00042.1 TIGR03862 family flavoprotein [Salipiger sp. PrR002]NDW56166.1 TIGR03862 family flavoprotein [Salipiger sp. PrR004]
MSRALVIGGGPAGLMAAEALLSAGHGVTLAEAKPSIGRKLLMAGKSGLNITKAEPFAAFLSAYGEAATDLRPMLSAFPPEEVMHWAEGLGQTLFTGSTGRVFPHGMKASPLLRAWLARLDGMGLERHTRWRWTGWDGDAVLMDTPEGPQRLTPEVTVLALGGASWARLGSDGSWAGIFSTEGLPVTPFAPANAGLVVAWSQHMKAQFGAPLKGLAFRAGTQRSRGEAVISARGLEGGGLYPLSPALREGAPLEVDLCPDIERDTLAKRLARPRGKQSLSNHLRKVVKLSPAARALLMECARPLPDDPAALATLLKALPVPHEGLRPLDEAISVAGGVPFAALDEGLMLKHRPGTFVAGEMLDWEAPTGGYLLTGCLATGLWSGRAAAARLG